MYVFAAYARGFGCSCSRGARDDGAVHTMNEGLSADTTTMGEVRTLIMFLAASANGPWTGSTFDYRWSQWLLNNDRTMDVGLCAEERLTSQPRVDTKDRAAEHYIAALVKHSRRRTMEAIAVLPVYTRRGILLGCLQQKGFHRSFAEVRRDGHQAATYVLWSAELPRGCKGRAMH